MMGAPPADPAAAAGGGAPPMDPQIVDQLVGALEDLSNQFMSFAQETQTTIEQLKQEVAQQEEAISGFERQLIQLSADAAAQAKQPLSFG
jgi:cell division septum initiation protein DivIVA